MFKVVSAAMRKVFCSSEKIILATLCFYFMASYCHAQNKGGSNYRMMTYNVENLFDCHHDSLKNDYEFLPDSARGWNECRLQRKIVDISRVIVNAGGFEPFACIGLCEVENRALLERMTNGPLKRFGYRVIHQDSPDKRGIDVALLYNPKIFKPLHTRFVKVAYPDEPEFTTRDILYCKALLGKSDTLHIMMCHLPSQRADNVNSSEKRQCAFSIIKLLTDSIIMANSCANIIVMGDFNCPTSDRHYQKALLNDGLLVDMMTKYDGTNTGTYCFKGIYSCIDHVLASLPMTTCENCGTLKLSSQNVEIFAQDWMLDKPNKQGVRYPYRTYRGTFYKGGVSDHLPVTLNISTRK